MDNHDLSSRLSALLVLAVRPTPLLADLSTYSETMDIVNKANQFFVNPPTEQKNAAFADICAVFTAWLRDTKSLSKKLLLAVCLADNLQR